MGSVRKQGALNPPMACGLSPHQKERVKQIGFDRERRVPSYQRGFITPAEGPPRAESTLKGVPLRIWPLDPTANSRIFGRI